MVVKMKFGSHLYGTHTPESDLDIKGIYLPTKEECYLNKISKSINQTTGNAFSKNTSEDVDIEIYSLQYFMKLAINGEMIVIDMLHAPSEMIIESSDVWNYITSNRQLFYSKNLSGYLGYIRKQCAKYGFKGSRIAAMKELYSILDSQQIPLKMFEIWDKLPVNEYCKFVDNPKEERFRTYEFCGKKIHETIHISYAKDIVKRQLDSYGERARMAERNEGIDFKAISHAFRAGLQLKEIYQTGNLVYPLKDADFIRDIKQAKFHYVNDKIGEQLEDMLTEVEYLSSISNFQEKVSENKLNEIILSCY